MLPKFRSQGEESDSSSSSDDYKDADDDILMDQLTSRQCKWDGRNNAIVGNDEQHEGPAAPAQGTFHPCPQREAAEKSSCSMQGKDPARSQAYKG